MSLAALFPKALSLALAWSLLSLSFAAWPAGGVAHTLQDDAGGYEAKAKFLVNAPVFVDWPDSTFKSPTSPLQICVHGDFSFGTTLAELTRTETIKGHRMEVKWARKEEELPGCQLLFVSHSAARRYDKILEAVKNSTTLTVGEEPAFLKAGGMVELEGSPGKLWFDVNLDAVREGHLRLSAQLLSLARRVIQRDARGEAAKS